jgi:outer membrane protein assembly factor BamB
MRSSVRCLECGAETAETGQSCGRCGAPIGMPTADAPSGDLRSGSASRAIWRRPGIIAVAAGVAVAGLVTANTIISRETGTSSRPSASGTSSASARWIDDTGYYDTRPVVAGGTVYIGNEIGTVCALDAATGRLRWAYTAGSYLASGPEGNEFCVL